MEENTISQIMTESSIPDNVVELKMTPDDRQLSTQQKALKINLDELKYGAFVEIGAGQEVARQFFSAGAAAGTVAKTLSAYDMKVSDEIYGKAGAYVSKERVEQMLHKEYDLLIGRLEGTRPPNSTFFSYAATVTAKSFVRKSECHGWIGIRLQTYPNAEPSQILMHVRMLDDDNAKQSEALGILGVNVIYGAYEHKERPKEFIKSLLDNLGQGRIEIDVINFEGPYFEKLDNRLMNLQLVHAWCCRAVMFDSNGESVVPSTALRKRDVLVLRGSFRPPTNVHVDMLKAGELKMREIGASSERGMTTMAEITMNELSAANSSDQDFLDRVDMLAALGVNVLISDYYRYFSLRSWLRRYTEKQIGLLIGVLDTHTMFDEERHTDLEGGSLEAVGKLFSGDTTVLVYPTIFDEKLVTLDNVGLSGEEKHLISFLQLRASLVQLEAVSEENLRILTKETFDAIRRDDEGWHERVPSEVADVICEKYGICPSDKKTAGS